MFGKRRNTGQLAKSDPIPDSSQVYLGHYRSEDGEGAPLLYGGERHQLILGPNGSGKGASLLIPNLLRLTDVSVLAIDPKGELAATTAAWRSKISDVVILNPLGVLGIKGTGFNPLARIDPDNPDFVDDLVGTSEAMIEIEEKEPHWTQKAEKLVCGLAGWEVKLAKAEGRPPSLENVRRMLTEPDRYAPGDEGKRRLVGGFRHHVARACADGGFEIESLLGGFLRDSDEMAGVRSTADRCTAWILSPQMRENLAVDGIDFRELKRRPITVYVIVPPERLRSHGAWIRLVISQALRSLYSDGGLTTLFLLDEFPILGRMKVVEDAIGVLRGYRTKVLAVCQDKGQLDAIYGQERTRSLMANCGVIQSFGANDLDTAEWMSRRAGETTIIARGFNEGDARNPNGQSTNSGMNYQQAKRRLILPQDMFGLPQGCGLLWTDRSPKTIPFSASPYWTIPELAKRAQPNPYYQSNDNRRSV